MFTVSNKDVNLQISIAVFLCLAIIPCTVYSRSLGEINEEAVTTNTSSNATYDSYENYRLERISDASSSIHRKQTKKSSSLSVANTKNKSRIITRYIVRPGDTLTSIARKKKVTVQSIKALNHLNCNLIKKGMVLKISMPGTHGSHNNKRTKRPDIDTVTTNKPNFLWPIKTVLDFHQDGVSGVKSIGIIITGTPGSTVHSSASGTVKKIGRMRGFGNYIVISHIGRFSTVYSNVDAIMVSEGEAVSAGNAIGKIKSTEKKLHFQIDRAGKPENPLNYLPKKI